MIYSNASPLMVHGKNQQGLRWLPLKPLEVGVEERKVLLTTKMVEVEVGVLR